MPLLRKKKRKAKVEVATEGMTAFARPSMVGESISGASVPQALPECVRDVSRKSVAVSPKKLKRKLSKDSAGDDTVDSGALGDRNLKRKRRRLNAVSKQHLVAEDNLVVMPGPGKYVLLQSLESAPKLNGALGLCLEVIGDGRARVKLQNGKTIKIHPQNLKVLVQAGDATAYRKEHEIIVNDVTPPPFETFDVAECHLGSDLIRVMRLQGCKVPTPVQAQAWPIIGQGNDVVAVARTGCGKTHAFLLPGFAGLEKRKSVPDSLIQISRDRRSRIQQNIAKPCMLVMTPTRELAQQIFQVAFELSNAMDARACTVLLHGGVDKDLQIKRLKSGADVVIATPGRLLECLSGAVSTPSATLAAVTYLVLDEADKMLDLGFLQDLRRIVDRCPNPGTADDARAGHTRQTLFFTATWPSAVHEAASVFTSPDAVQLRVGQHLEDATRPTANTTVKQQVRVVNEEDKLDELKEILLHTMKPGETGIVFAKLKKTCDFLEGKLSWDPRSVESPLCAWCKALHGDREQWERQETLSEFRRMTEAARYKQKGLLVATDVAARGLDIPGVALVIIYDFADSNGKETGAEAYVHRIGRVGRAGILGKAITLFTPQDKGARELIAILRQAEQPVPPELEAKGGKGKIKGKGQGKGKGKAKHSGTR